MLLDAKTIRTFPTLSHPPPPHASDPKGALLCGLIAVPVRVLCWFLERLKRSLKYLDDVTISTVADVMTTSR